LNGIAYAISETNFTWIVPLGQPDTIYQWIKPTQDPLKVSLNEVIDVNLEVGCVNDDCGDMNISFYYSVDGICSTQYLIDDENSLRLESGSNPFNCGDMNSGDFCNAVIQIKGVKKGTYELWGKTTSSNADANYTSCGERTIKIPVADDIPLFMMVFEKKSFLPFILIGGGLILGGIILWRKKEESQTS